MTQAVPEVKTTTPQDQVLETNGVGTPSAGHGENITNRDALEEVIASDKNAGVISSAENELDTAITASKEATPMEVSPELQAANVIPHNEIADTEHASGAHIPMSTLGQTVGEFKSSSTEKPMEKDPFNAFDSGVFAKGNPKVYEEALFAKWARMVYAKIRGKIQAEPEPPKTMQPKTT